MLRYWLYLFERHNDIETFTCHLHRKPGNFGEYSNAVRKAGPFEILVTQEVYNIFPTVKSALLLSIVQNSIRNYSSRWENLPRYRLLPAST